MAKDGTGGVHRYARPSYTGNRFPLLPFSDNAVFEILAEQGGDSGLLAQQILNGNVDAIFPLLDALEEQGRPQAWHLIRSRLSGALARSAHQAANNGTLHLGNYDNEIRDRAFDNLPRPINWDQEAIEMYLEHGRPVSPQSTAEDRTGYITGRPRDPLPERNPQQYDIERYSQPPLSRRRYMARPRQLPPLVERLRNLLPWEADTLRAQAQQAVGEDQPIPDDLESVDSLLETLARSRSPASAWQLRDWLNYLIPNRSENNYPVTLLSDQVDEGQHLEARPGISPEWGYGQRMPLHLVEQHGYSAYPVPDQADEYIANTGRNVRAQEHQHLRRKAEQHGDRDLHALAQAAFGDPAENDLDFDALADRWEELGDDLSSQRARRLKTTPPRPQPAQTPLEQIHDPEDD